ncbi:MAG: protein kinase family protein [Candidatus Accumulibacter sp.]|jgi:serine/threonine protein kinase|uniref:protein kinase domain-containing protein n=1 Tax=Accumulibacter sp. TaxID=2053492 RepID=UPI00258C80AF|nr:protein kinase [Accumulibacter sp.]MBK8117734.1 protein kinase family protein [Accumulibacter sp.]
MDPISQNSLFLIDALEALPLLDGRYKDIKSASFDCATGTKRGCFSLVFSAFDVIEEKKVAIKFYDISPENLLRLYRQEAFRREQLVLHALVGKERCLQLQSALKYFELTAPAGLTIPCEYFVVDWLEGQIDHFFEEQHIFSAVDKLRLFNEIVLAVEALHRHTVFHRDVKPDNLRACMRALKRIVIAIDLGTAALWASTPALDEYTHQVGANGYAPPEAICFFAGDREIAPCADVYALGCLLYELFNMDHFFIALRKLNAHYEMFLAAMYFKISAEPDRALRIAIWKQEIEKMGRSIVTPPIDGVGSSVPEGIAVLLNRILVDLVDPNFRRRKSFEHVRRLIWAAIKALENEKDYQIRLARAKEWRRAREEKVRRREARFLAMPVTGMIQC